VAIISKVRLLLVSMTLGSSEQVCNDKRLSGIVTVVPVTIDVVPSRVELVHVLTVTPFGSVKDRDVAVLNVASSVTAPVCLMPPTSSVVADAELAHISRQARNTDGPDYAAIGTDPLAHKGPVPISRVGL
jgi:hypothetical protein